MGIRRRRLDGHRAGPSPTKQPRRGINVVLRRPGPGTLESTAAEIAREHGVEVRTVSADLAATDIGAVLAEATKDSRGRSLRLQRGGGTRPAASSTATSICTCSASTVNCATPVDPVPPLRPARWSAGGAAASCMISSMGGTQGAVNFSTYNAGKAFEWILTEILWTELADVGRRRHQRLRRAHRPRPTTTPSRRRSIRSCAIAPTPTTRSIDARPGSCDPSPPEEVATALLRPARPHGPVAYVQPGRRVRIARAASPCRASEATQVWRAPSGNLHPPSRSESPDEPPRCGSCSGRPARPAAPP